MARTNKKPLVHPIIGRLFWVPTRLLLGRVTISELEQALTVKYFDPQTQRDQTICMLDKTSMLGMVGLPRSYGRTRFPDLWGKALDRTVKGWKRSGAYPSELKPRNELQAAFIAAITRALQHPGIEDAQAQARTGSGKTIALLLSLSLSGAGPCVVGVPTNRLKNQWIERCKMVFGAKWVARNVGVVQQGKCDYKDKLLVIAMMPSLCARKYDRAFYRYFGVVAIDEVHKTAAPILSQVLGMFPAHKHIGLTATPRKGERGKVTTFHIGSPSITSDQEVMKPTVFRVHYDREIQMYADTAQALTTMTARMVDRNAVLAALLYWRGYCRGRRVVGLSDRTDQILKLKQMLVNDYGVPPNEIGVYVGAHKTGKFKPSCTVSAADGSRIAQIRMAPSFKSKAAANNYVDRWLDALGDAIDDNVSIKRDVKPEMHKVKDDEYARIEAGAPFTLATFGIFAEGIDIPELDFGCELTPRGDVEQAVGRVLRTLPGKPTPEWYSLYDKFWYIEEENFFGETSYKKIRYKASGRLEKRRRLSYRNQNAVLKDIRNVEQALETAKANHQGKALRRAA